MQKKFTALIVLLILIFIQGPVWAKSYLIAVDDDIDSIRLFNNYIGPSKAVAELRRAYKARIDVVAVTVNSRPNPFNRYLTDNYDLIIGLGATVSQTVYNAAKNHEYQRYAMIDMNRANIDKNAIAFAYSYAEAGYIAGFTAAKTTQTGSIGLVCGQRITQVQDFARGYKDGAKYADEKVKVNTVYINDFFDAYTARSQAEEMFRSGADVVCHLAGLSGQGVIEAAQNYGKWAISVDGSETRLPKNVLAAVIINYEMAIYEACQTIEENRFEGGSSRLLNLSNNGIMLNLAASIPSNVTKAVLKVKDDIASGKIMVRNNNNRIVN